MLPWEPTNYMNDEKTFSRLQTYNDLQTKAVRMIQGHFL